jgi:nucleotide-binding universal stress UspA family protein
VSYRRIVVGVDFGAASLAAVRWVAHELAPRAHLHLVYVAPDPRSSMLLRPYVPESADPFRDVHDISHALRGLANVLGADRVDVDIVEGVAADALALVAAEVDADLVCVGKSHHRAASGRFGATTPHRLLARTNAPVLVVPEAARVRPAAILAAMSEGRESSQVLQVAARLATAHGAHLDVLHALEEDVQQAAAAAQRFGCHTRLSTIAQNWLGAQVKRLPAGRPGTSTLTPTGDAGEAILVHAARGHIGLIVAGRCRQNEIMRATASPGSSTRLLLWAAPCPVLVLGTVAVERQPPQSPRRRDVSIPALSVVPGGDAA